MECAGCLGRDARDSVGLTQSGDERGAGRRVYPRRARYTPTATLATPATTHTAIHARDSSASGEREDEGDGDEVGPPRERDERLPRDDRGVDGSADGDETSVVSLPGGGASSRSGVDGGGKGTRSATDTIGVTPGSSGSIFASIGAAVDASRVPDVIERRVLGPPSFGREGSGSAFSSSGMAQATSTSTSGPTRAVTSFVRA